MRDTRVVLSILGGLIGCGGATAPPGAASKEPPSIATTDTDREIAKLEPAPLGASDGKLAAAIATYFEANPTKRSYIMTDKPLYQPGETIWLRVDVRATKDLRGAAPTGMTLQLVSPRGAFVATKRVLAQGGVAKNDLVLPDDMEGGEYTLNVLSDDGLQDTKKLVVSTYEPPRLQKTLELLRKAYGEGDAVAAAVEIKRATGEPFADKTLTAVVSVDDVETARLAIKTDRDGKAFARFQLPTKIARGDGLLTILANDSGVTESIQKRIPIVMKTLQLAVYPEGGDLVDNVPGRVYFAAKTPLGKPADIEGKVVDDRGLTVATFTSVHDGMGRFELTPSPDRRYRVEVTKPAGIATTIELPAARPGGCVLRSVDPRGTDKLRIAAVCNTARKVVVEATMREQRLAGGTVDVPAGKPVLVELPVDPAAQGVARVTLFSFDPPRPSGVLRSATEPGLANEPLAERLVYHGMSADLKVTITADKKTYAPRDRVKLKLHAEANGKPVKASLAIAVVDESVLSFADDKSARILARMLLEPELGASAADPIEEPNRYFGDDAKAAAAMDALLATRGYRRFEWRPVLATVEGAAQ